MMSCRIEGGEGHAGRHSCGAAATNDHATWPDKIYSDESTRRNRTGMVITQLTEVQTSEP
jgi:hypothetical protein